MRSVPLSPALSHQKPHAQYVPTRHPCTLYSHNADATQWHHAQHAAGGTRGLDDGARAQAARVVTDADGAGGAVRVDNYHTEVGDHTTNRHGKGQHITCGSCLIRTSGGAATLRADTKRRQQRCA